MPRVDHTPQSIALGGLYSNPSANAQDIAWVAATPADDEQFTLTGKEILLAWNTDPTNPYTVTITSVAVRGRSGDVSAYSLAAGEIAQFSPAKNGFRQTNGKLYFEANNAAVKFAVLKIA